MAVPMAEEIEMAIFGGSEWWDRPRTTPYSAAVSDDIRAGSFSRRSMNYCLDDIRSRSCKETNSEFAARVSAGNSNFCSADFQIVGSPATSMWNHCSGGRANESDYIDSILEEDMSSSRVQGWIPKSCPSTGILGDCDSSMDAFKHINEELSNNFDQSEPAKGTSPTCQQVFSTSAFPFGYSPSIIQGLMQPEEIISNQSSIMNFHSSLFKPSFENGNQLPPGSPIFRNASCSQLGTFQAVSSPSQLAMPSLGEAVARKIDFIMKLNNEDVRHSVSVLKEGEPEPVYKRPRIETPLPTFKVRKEKLGDRVTALQQLVSPFGKNDTASVLHEAVEYIKFLHDQLDVLINQHLNNGVSIRNQHQVCERSRDGEGPKGDLRSRGLCLVPISTSSAVVNEIRADHIWMPNLPGGGTFLYMTK